MKNLESLEKLEQMAKLAFLARERAYAPYSNFKVGVCLESMDGDFFTGCNVENASYPVCQCAEATALGKMVSEGCLEIKTIFVVSDTPEPIWPCGSCRQQLAEFASPSALIYSKTKSGQSAHCSFIELIPKLFSKSILNK